QPLRGRWQLLSVERGRKPGTHHHGQRASRGRPPDREDVLMLRRAICTFLLAGALLIAGPRGLITGVDSVGLTVSDLDRSVEFYSKALQFRKVSEVEVDGDAYEHLSGVFGMRARIARMTLGGESIELTEYVAPRGLPMPVDSRSNDRWFQHVAII